jgi:hypothetical protein
MRVHVYRCRGAKTSDLARPRSGRFWPNISRASHAAHNAATAPMSDSAEKTDQNRLCPMMSPARKIWIDRHAKRSWWPAVKSNAFACGDVLRHSEEERVTVDPARVEPY